MASLKAANPGVPATLTRRATGPAWEEGMHNWHMNNPGVPATLTLTSTLTLFIHHSRTCTNSSIALALKPIMGPGPSPDPGLDPNYGLRPEVTLAPTITLILTPAPLCGGRGGLYCSLRPHRHGDYS